MYWNTIRVRDRFQPGRRLLRARMRMAAIGAILLLAYVAGAQTPVQADPAQKSDAGRAVKTQQIPSGGCAECALASAANLENATTPAPRVAIAEQDAQILKLAAQLKAEVDRCAPDTLQVDVVRKADLIRRLADRWKKEVKQTLRVK